jgi:hypothetical protein
MPRQEKAVTNSVNYQPPVSVTGEVFWAHFVRFARSTRSLALREAMPVRRTGNRSLAVMEIVRSARLD